MAVTPLPQCASYQVWHNSSMVLFSCGGALLQCRTQTEESWMSADLPNVTHHAKAQNDAIVASARVFPRSHPRPRPRPRPAPPGLR